MIKVLETVEEYDGFTKKEGIVIVHFGFEWNSFDRTMRRTLIELKPELGERIMLGFVDIDNNATIELLQRVNLVNSPTLIYFRNGEHLATDVGMKPMDEIRRKIQSLLKPEQFS